MVMPQIRDMNWTMEPLREAFSNSSSDMVVASAAGGPTSAYTAMLRTDPNLSSIGLHVTLRIAKWTALHESSVNVRAGPTDRVVKCRFISSINEEHSTDQKFQFSACALGWEHNKTTNPFGPDTIHLINLPGDNLHRGQLLELQIRPANRADSRKENPWHNPGPHWPLWRDSAKGFFVERIVTVGPSSSEAQRRKLASSRGAGRTLLSICMQYIGRSDSCSDAYEAWTKGVPQTHTSAAHNRLLPPWDQTNSRFYIINMDTAANALDLSFISCDTFLAQEPDIALLMAQERFEDAKLAYSHTEFLLPSNLANCAWQSIGEQGTYNPSGVATALLPEGLKTYCKGNDLRLRAAALGNSLGMRHSDSWNCAGYGEFGDSRCIMGGGTITFNAAQQLPTCRL